MPNASDPARAALALEREAALRAAGRTIAPAQTISTGKGAMRRVKGGSRRAPGSKKAAPAASTAAAVGRASESRPRGAASPSRPSAVPAAPASSASRPSLARRLSELEIASVPSARTPDSRQSWALSGGRSSYSWISPPAGDDWSLVDECASASSASDAGEHALDVGEVERRLAEARNRLPSNTLVGRPARQVRVADVEAWLEGLLSRGLIGADAYEELYTQMAFASASGDVRLAMRFVERSIDRAGVTERLAPLTRAFLQVADARAAEVLYGTLAGVSGQLAGDLGAADVADFLLGPEDGRDGRPLHRRALTARRTALEAHWRAQPPGFRTLPER